MTNIDPILTPRDEQSADETPTTQVEVDEAEVELQRIRKLRVMAAVSAPILMSLLLSKRASASSVPPPGPDDEQP